MQNQVTSFTLAAFLHGDLHLGTATRLYRKLWQSLDSPSLHTYYQTNLQRRFALYSDLLYE